MDEMRRMLDRLHSRLGQRADTRQVERADAPIPDAIAARLISDNHDDPSFPTFARFGKGRPGVTQERPFWWVIRDGRGRVVGGAMVASIGPRHPVSIDVAVDPRRRRQGFGTAL